MSGIDFTLADAEGKKIAEDTSDKEGMLEFDITEAGTYYIVETQTPSGYQELKPIKLVVGRKVYTDENKVTHIELYVESLNLKAESGIYLIENQANYIDVSVTKKWDYDADEIKRPGSVEIVLYRNGEEYDTVELSDDNDWTYTWENLPDYDTWTVDEEDVPSGFYRIRKHTGNDWTITNCATSNPKTGDTANILLLGSVMGISLMALAVLLILGKKNYGKR